MVEQLALKGDGEANGVVLGVADRSHGRPDAGDPAALGERGRGVVRSLVGVMDEAVSATLAERHVEGVEHERSPEMVGHRPADNAPAEGVEHHGEVEEVGPVGTWVMSATHRPFAASAVKARLTGSGAVVAHGGDDILAPADAGQAGRTHQPGDRLASDTDTPGRRFGVYARWLRRFRARRRESTGYAPTAASPPWSAPRRAGGATHDSRWRRRPRTRHMAAIGYTARRTLTSS